MATSPNVATNTKILKSKDGVEIYAEAVGDHSKPHVVFIHGICVSGVAWDDQFTSSGLLAHIYAVRYDLRGHGRSGKPLPLEAWTSRRFAEDFEAVVTAFDLKRPVLVGWSYGSTCAVDIVTAFGPSYLSGIIYVGALVYTHAHHIVTAWQSARIKKLLSYPESDVQAELVREEIVNGLFADPSTIPLEKRQALVAAMGVQPHAVLRRVLRREQDLTRFLSEGASIIPLLIIHGTQDQICDHDALIAEATSRFGLRNVEIESWGGVGHTPMLERTEQFNNTVMRWVLKVSS